MREAWDALDAAAPASREAWAARLAACDAPLAARDALAAELLREAEAARRAALAAERAAEAATPAARDAEREAARLAVRAFLTDILRDILRDLRWRRVRGIYIICKYNYLFLSEKINNK